MTYNNILVILALTALLSSCRATTDSANTSQAVPEEQISLGGVIAEQLLVTSPTDSSHLEKQTELRDETNRLLDKMEQLKAERKSVNEGSVTASWLSLQEQVLGNFENLSEPDLKSWVVLNDSLLKYSGEVRFADELERMVYNAPVPEVVTEQMIKSFCYTRLYDRIYLNVFGSSALEYEHTTGGKVKIIQDTEYPYSGSIVLKFELQDVRYLDLYVRIPEWAEQATVTVKGVKYNVIPGEYTEIARKWKNGDAVEVILGMSPKVVRNEKMEMAITYGSFLMSYSQMPDDKLVFTESDPEKYLRFVSPPGTMPTFTFSGIPEKTLVLQPFCAEKEPDVVRTAWIKTGN